MQSKKIYLLLLLLCSILRAQADEVYEIDSTHLLLCSDELHLNFLLDKETKEAMLGKDDTSNHNAIWDPLVISDDYDPNATSVNYWKDLVIPSIVSCQGEDYTVTSVSSYAFYKSTALQTITLPETVRTIGGASFGMCVYLKKVVLHEGIDAIKGSAFANCKRLTDIHLPSTISYIGQSAFLNCQALTSINIPSSCTSIGEDAFSYCMGLTNLTFDDGDEPISLGCAFEYGPDWTPYSAPYYYINRTWRGLFADCKIKNLYIGREIIVKDALVKDYSPFESLTQRNGVDNKVVNIRDGQSIDCVRFGDNVKRVSNNLFKSCWVKDVTLPKNVETIGENAFNQAIMQSTLVIPSMCQLIEKGAFAARNSGGTLKTIECQSITPPTVEIGGFGGCSGFAVAIPSGTRTSYSSDVFWGKYFLYDADDELISVNVKYAGSLYGRLAYADKEPMDVYRLKVTGTLGTDDWTTINSMTNLYELDLSEVEADNLDDIGNIAKQLRILKFPKGLKEISSKLFDNGSLTGTITIPQTCEKIGKMAFYGCDINKLIIEGPTYIEERAFTFCKNLVLVSLQAKGIVASKGSFYCVSDPYNKSAGLQTLIVGPEVTLKQNSFESCHALEEIVIQGDVEAIEAYAFYMCDNLSTLRFNGMIKEMNMKSFAMIDTKINIKELYIDDINSWAKMSFDSSNSNPISYAEKVYINGQEELINVSIPETVTSIGNYAFYGCPLINGVTMSNQVTSIGTGAFQNCANLNDVQLPEKLESIGSYAFENCINLKTIQIPEEIKIIEGHTFKNCSALHDVILPSELQAINEYAFSGCTSLSSLTFPLTLKNIANHAFESCSSINKIDLPYSLESIEDMAFAGCSNLKKIEAVWIYPFEINPTAFSSISSKCILWVPVDAVPNYYAKGWGRIPLIDEGFCVLNTNIGPGAKLFVNDRSYEPNDVVKVEIGDDAEIRFTLQDNCYLSNLLINGNDVTEELHDDQVVISDVQENKEISAIVRKFILGDVNDDDFIDIGDISAIVRFIQHDPIENSIAKAADVNQDGDIDVGDIAGAVNLIYEIANESQRCTSSHSIASYSSFQLNAQIETMPNNSTQVLSIGFDNSTSASGIQFELSCPLGFSIPQDGLGNYSVIYDADRLENMDIKSVTLLPNGNYLFLCSSTNKSGIPTLSGSILNVIIEKNCNTEDDSAPFFIRNIRVSDEYANVFRQEDSIIVKKPSVVTNVNEQMIGSLYNDGKHVYHGRVIVRKQGHKYSINGNKAQ